MIEIWGHKDLVKELKYYSKKFSVFELTSSEEYYDFLENSMMFKHKIMAPLIEEEENYVSQIDELKQQGDIFAKELALIDNSISEKSEILEKEKDNEALKEKTLPQIDRLKQNKKTYEDRKKNNDRKLYELEEKRKEIEEKKTLALKNIEMDIKKAYDLKKDSNFTNLLKELNGGDKKIIDLIRIEFRKNKDYYLINSFDINLTGKEISFEGEILKKIEINHILICPKGFYVFEIMARNPMDDSMIKETERQMSKIKTVMESIFDKKITENITYVIVPIKEPIILNKMEFDSVVLEELMSYFTHKEDIINEDKIYEFLYKLEPFLDDKHIDTVKRLKVRAKYNVNIRLKNKLKSFLKK